MAGGQGTRFWPASVAQCPKQFLKISGERTLFQDTVYRLLPFLDISDVFVVCSQRYVALVREQVPELSDDQIIVEPAPRNTAPCIGFAATYLASRFPGEVMAVLPADHVIREVGEFHRLLGDAERLAQEGWLVTFGIEPDHPSTGYGYLERGEEVSSQSALDRPAFRVVRFTEKPDLETAQTFLRSGVYSWNSGMFVWQIGDILNQLKQHTPRLYKTLIQIEEAGRSSPLAAELFSSCEKISIDYAVMERTDRAALFPCRLGWDDVGSWGAVRNVRPSQGQGIVSDTLTIPIDSRDCVVFSRSGKLVGLVGVDNLVVVETADSLLICAEDRAQEVKALVDELKARKLEKYL